MQHIETVTVGAGGAASITFSAIPDTFTDLLLKLNLRFSAGIVPGGDVTLAFNGSTSNFSSRVLFGSGSSANSFAITTPLIIQAATSTANTANTFGSVNLYIPNYLSGLAKSFSADIVTEDNATLSYQIIQAGLWNDVSAISSITLTPASGNFVEFSSASLYGITAGSDGIVTVS